MSKPETRIQELHLTLPPTPKPMAKYKTALLVGNMLYVSGHGPAKISDKTPLQGRVGADLTTEQGKECARAVGLNILSTVRAALGSLDKVKRLVKTLGMVNCTSDHKDQPQVINGFSELPASACAAPSAWDRCRAISRWRSSASLKWRPNQMSLHFVPGLATVMKNRSPQKVHFITKLMETWAMIGTSCFSTGLASVAARNVR
jgi:enamine deaminase RidA (YjgF/YER057c/UK114 family)